MIYLSNLKAIRISRGLTTAMLSELVLIPVERVRQIESVNKHKRHEPWLEEAAMCARVLGVRGVLPLIGSDNLTTLDIPFDPVDPRTIWKTGVRLPLSTACRIARAFGLSDPEALFDLSNHRQVWDVLEASERNPEASGWCPWCAADIHGGEPHHDMCLPHIMYAGRGSLPMPSPAGRPYPHTPGAAHRASAPGYGVRRLRERLGLTQQRFADALGMASDYLSKIETGRIPLTTAKARTIVSIFGGDMAELYAKFGADHQGAAPHEPETSDPEED